MSSLATFCNIPASTGFDGCAACSRVSLDWVINTGLRTRASAVSGLLVLPSTAGVISLVLNNVPVAASLAHDLVLGLDWVHLDRDSVPDLVVHLSCGPLNLRSLPSSSLRV
ncbi:hypothetical protein C8R43DRAFT_1125760 [Mycena crocata]|nr:hypothetical protein C8R43DRAFT_1125760 [Mycena crocata]